MWGRDLNFRSHVLYLKFREVVKMKKEKAINQKLEKICIMNCKTEDGKNKLDSLFEKVITKVFSYSSDKISEMSADDILHILRKFGKKYKMHLSYVFFHINPQEGLTGSLIDRNTPAYEMVCTAYAQTLEELFKKIILCIYFYVKGNKESEEN